MCECFVVGDINEEVMDYVWVCYGDYVLMFLFLMLVIYVFWFVLVVFVGFFFIVFVVVMCGW